MKENWLEHYRVDKPPSDVMCAYKLIKVEFRYWGMQVSTERFCKNKHMITIRIEKTYQALLRVLSISNHLQARQSKVHFSLPRVTCFSVRRNLRLNQTRVNYKRNAR